MPIRTASLNKQIHKNGLRLHQAIESRVHSEGAEHTASEHEKALLDERRFLKEAKAKHQALAAQPKPKAAKFVHHEAKAPKAPKAPKVKDDHKSDKSAKPHAKDHLSATDKRAKKAEALQAAKNAAKKSAKT
jgi:hypothetical protein